MNNIISKADQDSCLTDMEITQNAIHIQYWNG